MASQMLASVKGMRQDADGRYLRLAVRHRLKRTADLDGEVDAEPGLKIPGAVHHCPGRVG